jgi:hypothetical protein
MSNFPLLESLLTQNTYFKVLKPLTVWWLSGHKEMGRGALALPQFQKTELKKDDQIHVLVGGIFGVRKNGGDAVTIHTRDPKNFDPRFDKARTLRQKQEVDILQWEKDRTLVRLDPAEKISGARYGKSPSRF